ncbi:MAG: phosphoadenylyl-sulfate reductase [Proteobacteria bacterium]|nr:phosphoadenylyl-sulfate reductase [Pseudomonadota bacterium]
MTHTTGPLLKADPFFLQDYNRTYATRSTTELLPLLLESFYPELSFACSFGPEDLVLLHMLMQYEKRPEIFVLDTGRLPPETYDLIERLRLRYKVTIAFYLPDTLKLQSFTSTEGPNAFYTSAELRKQCCTIRKLEPLARALLNKKAWLTGLRREQSALRSEVNVFELDAQRRFKISPLLTWSKAEIWAYIKTHDIPYNTLHDRGYSSIGCAPCTRAIEAGEEDRAGRWWWEAQSFKECGLHLKNQPEVNDAPASL